EHQSLSRVRAWLHLLFRAADARVSRIFCRPRFRITHHGEAGRAAIARGRVVVAEMETTTADDERRDRLLSTGRAQAADHSRLSRGAREISEPGWHPDQEPTGDARHRHSDGIGAAQRRGGESFDYDVGSKTSAHSRAANIGSGSAFGCGRAIARG